MKKIGIVAAVALLGVGLAGWALSASAKPSAQPAGVKYFEHQTSSHYADNGASGFSPGDQFVFHSVLKQNGTKKGTVDGVCEVTQGPFGTCFATAKIGDSQLEIQLNAPPGNNAFKAGITGGTGQYRTARGYIAVKPINQKDSYDTVYVIP